MRRLVGFARAFSVVSLALAACGDGAADPAPAGPVAPLGDASVIARDASGADVVTSGDAGVDAGTDPCAAIPGASYIATSVAPQTTDAATHGDINLLLRQWRVAAGQTAGLVDIAGPTDPNAPRLYTLFTDDRMPTFTGVYQLESWDWTTNTPGPYMTDPAVTMAGFAMAPGEIVQLPKDGYDIGGGLQALVLYATTETITLKYTRDDSVVTGYTIHIANVCVEPELRALYERSNAAGRHELPGLAGNQPLGRARGGELLVTVRDTGSWMDPRSRKDWYQP